MSQFPAWQKIRDKALPFADDADWEGTNLLADAKAADALFGVPLLENAQATVRGVMILVQVVTTGGALATPAGTVAYVLSEVVGSAPEHLIGTGLSGTITIGTALAIDLAAAGALKGTGVFVLRLHTDTGVAATGTLRVFTKSITG